MGKYNGAIVTSAGQSLIANAVASNQKIIFTKLKASTRVYASTTDFEAMTSIADIVQSVDISYAGVYNNNVIQVSGRFTNTGVATAFTINTIGLYGKVGSGAETLVAVVTAVNADTMPVADPVSPTSIIYNIQMAVQNSGVMEVEVNDAGTINVHQFNDALYSTAAITVPTTGWTASGSQYTKTIDVGGITSSSMPFVELQYPDNVTATQKKAIDKAASKLVSLTTTNYGQVVLTATEVPATSFNLLLRGLGSGQYTQPYNEFFTTVLDKKPYVSREARDGIVKLNLVGGTVAWNQLVQNGNFADGTDNWSATRGTIDALNGVLSYTTTEVGSSRIANRLQQNKTVIKDHIYLSFISYKPAHTHEIYVTITGSAPAIFTGMGISTASVWNNLAAIFKVPSDGYNAFQYALSQNDSNYSVGDVDEFKNAMFFDITQMFGTAIADYIYSLEQSVSGSGIAWLKSYGFFAKDYYAYDAGSLQSVCTSARKITALDGTVRNYPIDNVQLRGLFKLDTNNKLYCDGDIYEASGNVQRRYGVVDLGTLNWSQDLWGSASVWYAVLSDAYKPLYGQMPNAVSEKYETCGAQASQLRQGGFTIGPDAGPFVRVYRNDGDSEPTGMLVYELATETTETADPYLSPQRSCDGTEEFIDGLTRDVMIPVGNESTYYLSEVLPSAADYTDGQVAELKLGLADTNKMIASEWSATAVYTRNQPVIYNGKLYIVKNSANTVPAGTLPTDTDYWSVFEIASGLKNILNRSFEFIGSISDFERVKSDLLTDQVTFCCVAQGIMKNVFGEQVFSYGFAVNFDTNTMRFYLFSSSYIFTGAYNIANGTWSSLTKTPLTTYTP